MKDTNTVLMKITQNDILRYRSKINVQNLYAEDYKDADERNLRDLEKHMFTDCKSQYR